MWIGLSALAVILISFLAIRAVTKKAFHLIKGENEGSLNSKWMPLQVYSGEDSLDHPDLKRMLEISELEENKRVK
jgi:hypothetical protein